MLSLAYQQAEEARRLKQEFAQTISHELRTPTNLVVGFTEVLVQNPEYYGSQLAPAYTRDLSMVHRNAVHLQNLVNDVLDLARIDNAQMTLTVQEVSPAELTSEAINTARGLVFAPAYWSDTAEITALAQIAAVAARRGIEPEDALFDLTLAERGPRPRCINDYIEDDHWRTAGWDHCILPCVEHLGFLDPASISPLDWRYCIENSNQGLIGFFPRVLGPYVREEKLLTLEEAVRKMTSYAMQRIGIADRGAIRPGMWADITVFEQDTIAWHSAHPDPERAETCYPIGIHYVFVNGQVAMTGHTHTGARAGQVLRKA